MATELGPVEIYISIEHLNAGRLHYTCNCGARFTLGHFIRAGARRVHRVRRMTWKT